MWVSMEVHMDNTIREGCQELSCFSALIKNFNFPKMHAHMHVSDHILEKGVTAVYSTKLFERLHSPLKKWYQLQSNFKNIAPQVCL
ncbi:hypothetical protein L208DRAFT_1092878, partial [Tricholoma matsutake]